MKKIFFIACGVLFGVLVMSSETTIAASYNDHVNKARRDAEAWRNQAGINAYYDYAWISNMDGGDRLDIAYNATCATVRLNVFGQSFRPNYYRIVESSFSVIGRTGVYTQTQPNPASTNYTISHQTISCFNVAGLSTGRQPFTMRNVGTRAVMFNGVETPWSASQPSSFDLDIVRADPPWRTSATTAVSPTRVFPGQSITWTHSLRNDGPANITAKEIYNYATRRINGVEGSTRYSEARTATEGRGRVELRRFNTTYTTLPSDIGAQVCEQLAWSPKAVPAEPDGRSGWACATVRSDFSLYPHVAINGDSGLSAGYITPGDSFEASSIDQTINNRGDVSGADRITNNHAIVNEFIVKKDNRIEFANNLNSYFDQNENSFRFGLGSWTSGDACTSWLAGRAPYVDCGRGVKYDDGNTVKYLTDQKLPDTSSIGADDAEYGDLICRMVSIKDYDHQHSDSNERRISVPACVMVTKKPKVQFSGADARSNGNVYTSSTLTSLGLYGSWAEYAIMSSNGTVRSASGAALSTSGVPSSTPDMNRLTFANVNASGVSQYGRFGGAFTQPSIGARFPDSSATTVSSGSVNVSSLAPGAYTRDGNLSIDGGEVGQKVVIRSTGTVTITGDITYTGGTYASTANLPQLIIIASNIVINDTVGRVDAWLVAEDGYVSTCGVVSSGQWSEGLNAATCAGRLLVNGPVVAKNLYLRRTFGESGDQPTKNPGTPAETINLRPDAYLYASAQSQTTGSIRTMHMKELPPRF